MKEWEDYEEQNNHEDHESEKEQHSTILFTPQQLEVMLKTNRPDCTKLVETLKKNPLKV